MATNPRRTRRDEERQAKKLRTRLESEQAIMGAHGQTHVGDRWKRPWGYALGVAIFTLVLGWLTELGLIREKGSFDAIEDSSFFLGIMVFVMAWCYPMMIIEGDESDFGYPERGRFLYQLSMVVASAVGIVVVLCIGPFVTDVGGDPGSYSHEGLGAPLAIVAITLLCAGFLAISTTIVGIMVSTMRHYLLTIAMVLLWLVGLFVTCFVGLKFWDHEVAVVHVLLAGAIAAVGLIVMAGASLLAALINRPGTGPAGRSDLTDAMIRRHILEKTGKTFPQYPGQEVPQWALDDLGLSAPPQAPGQSRQGPGQIRG